MKPIIVIPNHLSHLDFLQEWKELQGQEIIIIQDIGKKPKIPKNFFIITIFDHQDIKKDLGRNEWIIPSRTSACRSYGYYKAWQRKPGAIITLDNDCYPEGSDYFVTGHINLLQDNTTLDWVGSDGFVNGVYTRGFPYQIRDKSPVMLNHGLWSNIPDLDAPTSLQKPNLRFNPANDSITIPRNNFVPVCGMNLAWRAEITPMMYFGIFGPDYGFDQFDDIWAGVLIKKILDHLKYAMRSGYPSVEHRKQSDVFVNLKKQAPGMAMNEEFWQTVQRIELTKNTVIDCYEELITQLPDKFITEPPGWTKKFKKAALLWISLFR